MAETVNLSAKVLDKLQTAFKLESLTANRLSKEYSFIGVKTAKVLTPTTIPMTDYNRGASANRYGTPTEMKDTVQELQLSQEKSFSLTVDKGNYVDQNYLKKGTQMMALQLKERAVPLMDRYVLDRLAHKAGTIHGDSTALSPSNIVARISAGTTVLDNAECPASGRTLFVSAAAYAMLKHSTEFLAVDSIADKALRKGAVGEYDNMEVVKVPSGRWPSFVNFIIVHKAAAIAPVKLSEHQIHKDPPGIGGMLLEGREYYDCFVFGAKCNGVYCDVDTGSNKATVVATPTQSSGTFASTTTGASFKYTNDGSDPRYSASAIAAASESEATGTVIKVYAYKTDCYDSAVLEYTA